VPQVQQLPHATLVAHFGAERAGAIEQAVRIYNLLLGLVEPNACIWDGVG
jgi:hypothetical protein